MRIFTLVAILMIFQSCSAVHKSSKRFPASDSSLLVANIYGCFGSVVIKEGKGKKERIISETKAVVYRGHVDYFSSISRLVYTDFDLGKVMILTGSKKSWSKGVTSGRYNYESSEEIAALDKIFKITPPENTILQARQDTSGLYVIKSADGKYQARQLGLDEFTMDKCTSDVEQVKKWLSEISEYTPF